MSESATKLDYWPHKVEGGVVLNLLSINVCIDFGGRQAQVEFQQGDAGSVVDATYFFLTDEWSADEWSTSDLLTTNLRRLFSDFDPMLTQRSKAGEGS